MMVFVTPYKETHMEHERYRSLRRMVRIVAKQHRHDPRCTHDDATIVLILLWAALHDRAVSWACVAKHWPWQLRPKNMPSQSCVSRRWRRQGVMQLLASLFQSYGEHLPSSAYKFIDATPLPVGGTSRDPQRGWGYCGGMHQPGYQLISVMNAANVVESWCVAPLGVAERTAAHELLPFLSAGDVLVGDKGYDQQKLYEHATRRGIRLITPAVRRGGHAPTFRSCPQRGQADAYLRTTGGRWLKWRRVAHERLHATLKRHPYRLDRLPPHVRTLARVQMWVGLKLLIYHNELLNTPTRNAA